MIDGDAPNGDPYEEALNAKRLNARIAAVTNRKAKAVSVGRADGTVFLRGRRRGDRSQTPTDRRNGERRHREVDSKN